MRAIVLGVLLTAGLLIGSGPGLASVTAQPEPTDACTMADKRLGELSGLVADGEHWYAVNDGGTKSTVYVLNPDCTAERTISGPTDPYDVEDLAVDGDGTFWLADTGDNDKKRETVALIALTPAGKTTLYRLTYPDGAHDTEALILDRSGVPYLITKEPLGTAGIYRPGGELDSPGPTALEQVGTLRLSPTNTPGGPLPGIVGSVVVTGAASTADGTVVAIRTYTDAYLYGVPDGDLVGALTTGEPVHIPLPNEAQGEAIAFQPDGALISASEETGSPIRTVAGAAQLAAPPPPPPPAPQAAPGGVPNSAQGAESGGKDGYTVPIVAGATVALAGLILLVRRRRAR